MEEDGNFKEVAVKTLKAITIESELDNFYEEIEIALRFEHKNVVRCLGFYEDMQNHKRPYMILEHMSMGSLDKVLLRYRQKETIDNICQANVSINHFNPKVSI